jgi:hypothetical protein
MIIFVSYSTDLFFMSTRNILNNVHLNRYNGCKLFKLLSVSIFVKWRKLITEKIWWIVHISDKNYILVYLSFLKYYLQYIILSTVYHFISHKRGVINKIKIKLVAKSGQSIKNLKQSSNWLHGKDNFYGKFHVIVGTKNFHFLWTFNSERGIDIHLCIQDEQETEWRQTKQNKQRN